jgi:hypothetical protein
MFNAGTSISIMREPQEQIVEILRIVRNKSVETRIHEVFMEIDQLGNYTNSHWFSVLSEEHYCLFYRQLFNIWRRLPNDITNKIFLLGHPFSGYQQGITSNRMNHLEYIREVCLFVIENFVYGGIDIEYRKIGALHVLTALTAASIHARNSMYWLYESLIY